jgi:hypothetical protein
MLRIDYNPFFSWKVEVFENENKRKKKAGSNVTYININSELQYLCNTKSCVSRLLLFWPRIEILKARCFPNNLSIKKIIKILKQKQSLCDVLFLQNQSKFSFGKH